MFRNKKNSEKSERKKAAGAQARQAADEKLQELKVKAEQSPKSQAVLRFMNRYSILFHVLLSCGVCFVIEWVSRHSFLEACSFVVDRNLVFLYNSLIVFASAASGVHRAQKSTAPYRDFRILAVPWNYQRLHSGEARIAVQLYRSENGRRSVYDAEQLFYRRGSNSCNRRCEPCASVSCGAVV